MAVDDPRLQDASAGTETRREGPHPHQRPRGRQAACLVRAADVLTLPLPAGVKVLKVLHLPERRGPASEAQASYELVP